MDLKELHSGVDPHNHWYYAHKSQLVTDAIIKYAKDKHTVIDVGAGSGFFAEKALEVMDTDASAICVDINYTDIEIQESHPKFNKTREATKLASNIYLMIDVLEHVSSDKKLLESYVIQAEKDATFIITVPAFQFLWSSHDVYLEHYRRYTLKMLSKTVQDSGLEIVSARYVFAPVLPIAYAGKILDKRNSSPKSRMGNHNKYLARIASWVLSYERKMTRNKIGGVTVLLVARKP